MRDTLLHPSDSQVESVDVRPEVLVIRPFSFVRAGGLKVIIAPIPSLVIYELDGGCRGRKEVRGRPPSGCARRRIDDRIRGENRISKTGIECGQGNVGVSTITRSAPGRPYWIGACCH